MCGYFVRAEENRKTAIFSYIRENLPAGQVYICDPLTAERLTIFSYNYVLFDYMNIINNEDLKKESSEIYKEIVLLNNFNKAMEYITKYDIRYVLIPKEFNICTGFIGEKLGHGREMWGYSGSGFNRYYKESGENYYLYPKNFVLIKEDDYYMLYQIFPKGN
jgi:hypothetical protein